MNLTYSEVSGMLEDPRYTINDRLIRRHYNDLTYSVIISDSQTGLSGFSNNHHSIYLCRQEALERLLERIAIYEDNNSV
jgi:hypothetical protein